MDPRRLMILAGALGLSGCALLRTEPPVDPSPGVEPAPPVAAIALMPSSLPPSLGGAGAAANPWGPEQAAGICCAGATETTRPPEADALVGAVRIFAWAPGRVYPVRTAPLRVTTLTLGPGETLVAKAAGDTVRWQIGETTSGEGAARRVHVLVKPLQRGLDTNLVLTTSRRVYLVDLTSGTTDRFNVAVAWDGGALEAGAPVPPAAMPGPDPVAVPRGPLDARYRIEPRGRRARWTPRSVFNDGLRTFIAFDADLQIDEAPALFVIAPDGEAQMVNYRQAGGLFIVDRVFDRAELRLGDRRPQIVRLVRLGEGGR